MRKTAWSFGARGWFLIFFSMSAMFCSAVMTADGINVALPLIAEAQSLDYDICLGMGTLAGLISVPSIFLIGKLREQIGSYRLSGLLIICTGAIYAVIYVGARSVFMYAVGLCLLLICVRSCIYLGTSSLQTQWFPRKKGLVLGISTLGPNLATAVTVPLLTFLSGAFGYRVGLSFIGWFAVMMGILELIILRDDPMELGIFPDNVSREEYDREYIHEQENQTSTYKSDWTVKRLLTNRSTYAAAIVPAVTALCVSGVITQFILRNQEVGMSAEGAAISMTVAALLGILGNYALGVIVTKLGAKKAVILYCLFFASGILLNLFGKYHVAFSYLAIPFLGCSLGGTVILQMTWPSSIFGRLDYPKANGVIYPMINCIGSMNFFINALFHKLFGNLTGAYVVYLILLLGVALMALFTDSQKWDKDVHPELFQTAAE